MIFFGKINIRFGYSNKYTKRIIYKRTVKKIRYYSFRRVYIKLFYNSIFAFTAKSLVTNTADITTVLCISTCIKATYKFAFTFQNLVGWFKIANIVVSLLYVVFFAVGPGKHFSPTFTYVRWALSSYKKLLSCISNIRLILATGLFQFLTSILVFSE